LRLSSPEFLKIVAAKFGHSFIEACCLTLPAFGVLLMTVVSAVAPSLLRAKEAAQFLAISERSLWALTQAGDIQSTRIGRSVRYAPAALADFIERQSTGKRK
jgi:excisionase family DNA binding protein